MKRGPTSVVTLIVVYRNYENVKQNCFMWGKSKRYILYNNSTKKPNICIILKMLETYYFNFYIAPI